MSSRKVNGKRMQIVSVGVPCHEYGILEGIAKKFGLTVSALLQQETDRCIESAMVWLHRADEV